MLTRRGLAGASILLAAASASAWVLPAPLVTARGRARRTWVRRSRLAATTEEDADTATSIEHQNVPQAHAGLHDFLYDGGEGDVHSGAAPAAAAVPTAEAALGPTAAFLAEYGRTKFAAVYAVHDASGAARYVGVTRDLATAVRSHVATKGAEAASAVRYKPWAFPKRDAMSAERDVWLAACLPAVPAGNAGEAGWAASAGDASAAGGASSEGAAAYDANKLKMRRAMADKDVDLVDDWSAEIDAQTDETSGKAAKMRAAVADAAKAAGEIVSPFAAAGDYAGDDDEDDDEDDDADELEFTIANCELVLDEVRPFLIADGGNIRVVSVDPPAYDVTVALQGACGTCPSSLTTMKQGVEKVLREAWPTLGDVKQVSDATLALLEQPTPESVGVAVEAVLDRIRPAINAMGGKVLVESIVDGDLGFVVNLDYTGPDKVAYGLGLAIRDVPSVGEVVMLNE